MAVIYFIIIEISCDGFHITSRELPSIGCRKMVSVEPMPNLVTQLLILFMFNRLPFPAGVFFLGSLCCTVVFYLSLFLFLSAYYFFAFVIRFAPTGTQRVLDWRALRDNSILILVAASGLPISLYVALLR